MKEKEGEKEAEREGERKRELRRRKAVSSFSDSVKRLVVELITA